MFVALSLIEGVCVRDRDRDKRIVCRGGRETFNLQRATNSKQRTASSMERIRGATECGDVESAVEEFMNATGDKDVDSVLSPEEKSELVTVLYDRLRQYASQDEDSGNSWTHSCTAMRSPCIVDVLHHVSRCEQVPKRAAVLRSWKGMHRRDARGSGM